LSGTSLWKPDIPPREKVEAAFPRDVFDAPLNALEAVFWLDLSDDRRDVLLQRAGTAEEQPEEMVVIWNRLGDDRIKEIEALRDEYDAPRPDSGTTVAIGSGEFPEYENAWMRGRDASSALLLDYKSLFVFGDILLGAYVALRRRCGKPTGVGQGHPRTRGRRDGVPHGRATHDGGS
jgi:hypothetical protein